MFCNCNCSYDGADRSKEALKRFVDQGCAGSLGAQDMGVKLYGKKRDVRPPPEMPDECEKWEAKSAPAWLRDKSAQDKEVAKVLGLSKGYPRVRLPVPADFVLTPLLLSTTHPVPVLLALDSAHLA